MAKCEFVSKLENLWSQGNFVCVGLDSDYSKLPLHLKEGKTVDQAILEFNIAIIKATADLVCAYKPQSSYYEEQGVEGSKALQETADYLHQKYPHIPTILDAKRGDIGPTSQSYARAIFDRMGFDALTVQPYLGQEAVQPFLNYKDKGSIVLCRTSNPGAKEFQDQLIDGEPLYQIVARNVAQNWNKLGNCAVVVGATYPEELAVVRGIIGDMPILIPGIGAQGGDIESTVKAGKNSKGQGMIINSSRGIIFASSGKDFAEAARAATQHLRAKINSYR